MTQDNLTSKQNDYALFLPAISGFYATFVGRQREANTYVDPARMPQGIKDMEMMNWLNSQKALFPYKWSLYSGGHANLDLSKHDWSEDMVRNREAGTVLLGDSGGFQIAKGVWEGDWHAGSGCPKAQKKREKSLAWLDNIADYGMTLDIPTWVIELPESNAKIGNFRNSDELVEATKYNNEYFIANRRGKAEGGAKFLNVLQGASHAAAEQWYQTMKGYCDPVKYPGRHFDGWGMGGQNMCDVHLILQRLVALRHDNLLQTGIHDWMHFLGTSRLEWACLLTDIQRAVRRYVNPNFTISFDCASPFLATANGQVYHEIDLEHDGKWTYRMSPLVDDKKYSTDTRPYSQGVVADGFVNHFEDSPISSCLKMKDICIYRPGDLNKNGKEGRTSWDSFSYALLMGHNVWMHIESVQRANREYNSGNIWPGMMWNQKGDGARFRDIVDAIFATPDRAEAESIIGHYSTYWTHIIGGRGFTGKRAINARTQFGVLFEEGEVDDQTSDTVQLDINALEQLEQEQQ